MSIIDTNIQNASSSGDSKSRWPTAYTNPVIQILTMAMSKLDTLSRHLFGTGCRGPSSSTLAEERAMNFECFEAEVDLRNIFVHLSRDKQAQKVLLAAQAGCTRLVPLLLCYLTDEPKPGSEQMRVRHPRAIS